MNDLHALSLYFSSVTDDTLRLYFKTKNAAQKVRDSILEFGGARAEHEALSNAQGFGHRTPKAQILTLACDFGNELTLTRPPMTMLVTHVASDARLCEVLRDIVQPQATKDSNNEG